MNRIWYYGTIGSLGHQAKGINVDLNQKEVSFLHKTVDSYAWMNAMFRQPKAIDTQFYYRYGIFYEGKDWSVMAWPFSVDDNRPGSHTEVFWEGFHTESDMVNLIMRDKFLSRQFNVMYSMD